MKGKERGRLKGKEEGRVTGNERRRAKKRRVKKGEAGAQFYDFFPWRLAAFMVLLV